MSHQFSLRAKWDLGHCPVTKMNVFFTTLAVVYLARVIISTTYVRLHENDVITGTQQITRIVTSVRSRIACARTCSLLAWCSVFAADDLAGTCELRDLPRISLIPFTSPPYSNRWKLLRLNEWCPVNNGFYFSAALRFCFTIVTNLNATWFESRNECIRRGLDLAVLDTTLKINIVLKMIKNTPGDDKFIYFLGATRPMADLSAAWNGDFTRFDWISGAPLILTKDLWGLNQPNNVDSSQNCLVMDGDVGLLINDLNCYEYHYFVCEKSEPVR